MQKLNRIFWIALVALSLGACSGIQHRAFNPTDRQDIKTIGLLTPAVPDTVSVKMSVHPGQSLGMVGTLIARSDMNDKSADFTHAAQGTGFVCSKRFKNQLEAGLNEAGFAVKAMNVSRPTGGYDFLKRYPADDGSVDAYLDLYSDLVGFTAAGGTTPYRPTVLLHVRLVRASDHKVLYQDAIAYNAFGDGDGAVTIAPSRQYEFPEFAELMANPLKALEGLQLAMRATGEELARQLR